jgi:hypothetical protein
MAGNGMALRQAQGERTLRMTGNPLVLSLSKHAGATEAEQ